MFSVSSSLEMILQDREMTSSTRQDASSPPRNNLHLADNRCRDLEHWISRIQLARCTQSTVSKIEDNWSEDINLQINFIAF